MTKTWFILLIELVQSVPPEKVETVIRTVALLTGVKNVDQLVEFAKFLTTTTQSVLTALKAYFNWTPVFGAKSAFGVPTDALVNADGYPRPDIPVEAQQFADLFVEL